MSNTIETATIFQEALDRQLVAGATSGWMEANAGQVKYSGGKEIKIPSLSLDGLGNYDRDDGYPRGAVAFSYKTKEMTQDRGRKFRLDVADVDETNFVMCASNVLAEFQRTRVIPEVDAYRYSRIFKDAAKSGRTQITAYTPAAATILATLSADIAEVQNVCGADVELIVLMSIPCANTLDNATGIEKHINPAQFSQGSIKRTIKEFDGCPIIRVPAARFMSDYTFHDGETSGEEKGGFAPTATAEAINWIVIPRSAPIAVSRTDNVQIVTPEDNQNAHAWDINYRKYHDLWIPDNRLDAIKVNKGAAANADLSALTLGSLTLSPTFSAEVTRYTTATTNTTNTITATAAGTGATVAILNGLTTVESGAAATWVAGENIVRITVTNGSATKTYTVIVKKS